MTAHELEAAWDAVHDAMPPGWYVGQPSYHGSGNARPRSRLDAGRFLRVGEGAVIVSGWAEPGPVSG